jgi:hypothetical protein
MNRNKPNAITLKELLDSLDQRIELLNNRLLNNFNGKLINAGIMILLLPFVIKLATESTRREIIGFFLVIGMCIVIGKLLINKYKEYND